MALVILVGSVVLLGHFSFWIFWFNRLNATGLQRTTIKRLEKLVILAAIVIPLAIVLLESELVSQWWREGIEDGLSVFRSLHAVTIGYAIFAAFFLFVVAPPWLLARGPLFSKADRLLDETHEHWNVADQLQPTIFSHTSTRWPARIPGNQIGQLQLTTKTLSMPGLPPALDGLRIGHVSDVHLTGRQSDRYHRFALKVLWETRPDVLFLTGDIVDYDSQLERVQPLFNEWRAPLGNYFVLGNHDRRLSDPTRLRRLLTDIGWIDLGSRCERRVWHGAEVEIAGNERPWFGEAPRWDESSRNDPNVASDNRSPHASDQSRLRIAVSHSPDQIGWAARGAAHLFLAGHTHGGQIRLPLVGPIIAPSWYGSRFASGVFEYRETLMHVSRGLSGIHPIRLLCCPEVSLLILKGDRPRGRTVTSRKLNG